MDIRQVVVLVCPLSQKLRTYELVYALSPSLSSFGAASVMMCCFARPASSSAPSVLPENRIGRKLIYIRRGWDHINVLDIFDQTCIVSKLC